MQKIRSVVFYKNYFSDFFEKQNAKVQEKILWTLRLIEEYQKIPDIYLKHLTGTDGIYEIRIQHGSAIFRIFCFFNRGKFIVLMNGFNKKTQKTPRKEIKKAIKIKQAYENES